MQESTTTPTHPFGTGSVTIADIIGLAAERYGEQPAARFKRDGEWCDVSYTQLGETVSEIARGLIDLGLQASERVALLCTTRVEWSYADFGITCAGACVVPIYPTNSPEECAWVAGNSESRFIVCEDASQVAKIVAVRDELPKLEAIISIEPADGAISLDELRERGRARDAGEVAARVAAVKPEDPYTIIYTSGTTGPPKGCVLSHGNYRRVTQMCEEIDVIEAGEPVYLYLPLAHSYALLIQLLCVDLGAPLIYWSGDPQQIVAGPDGDPPGLPPERPAHLREDLHAGHEQQRPGEDRRGDAAGPEGPRACRRPGSRSRSSCRRRSTKPTRSSTPTSAASSAASSSRRPPARRRSAARSSSSSTPAARPCSRATG